MAAIAHARPGLGLLSEELDGDAVMRGDVRSVACCGYDAVVVAGREVHPTAHLLSPRDDLGMVCLNAERHRRLARTTTVDLYGHLVPEAGGRARDALDRAFTRR